MTQYSIKGLFTKKILSTITTHNVFNLLKNKILYKIIDKMMYTNIQTNTLF